MSSKLPLVVVGLLVAGLIAFAAISSLKSPEGGGAPHEPDAPPRAPDDDPGRLPPPPPDFAPGPLMGEVAGRVLEPDGSPAAGAKVALFALTVDPSSERIRTLVEASGREMPAEAAGLFSKQSLSRVAATVADAQGRFSFETEIPGPFAIKVHLAGFAEKTVNGVKKGTRDVTITLDPGGGVVGAVQTADGSPVEGATVEIGDRSVVTDASGGFEIENVAVGDRTVKAEAEGYDDASATVYVTAGATAKLESPLVLAAKPGLTGRVLDPDGKPLANVKVGSMGGLIQVFSSENTDRGGRYHLGTPDAEEVTLHFRHIDYLPAQMKDVPVRKGEIQVLPDLRLKPGGEIVGRITRPDGMPVREAQVVALPMEGARDLTAMIGSAFGNDARRSDVDGKFRVAGLQDGNYRLAVAASGFVTSVTPDVAVRIPEKTRVDVKLSRGQSISGVVVDAQDEPIAGAKVATSGDRTFVSSDDMMLPRTATQATTDGEGRFTLTGFKESRPVKIEASMQGYLDAKVAEIEPGTADLKITLNRGGGITGRVVDAETGEPVGGAHVEIGTDSAPFPMDIPFAVRRSGKGTAEDGSFEIKPLQPGTHTVTARHAGFAPASVEGVVVIEGKNTEDIEIRLGRGERVRGVVVRAADGIGVPGAGVRFSGAVNVSATADEAGRIDVRGFLAGHYDVTVTASGYAEVKLSGVQVPQPEELRIEVTRGGTIRGIVRNEEGKPAGQRMVMLNMGEGFGRNTKPTGADGTFVFENVAPGKYDLVVLNFGGGGGMGFSTRSKSVTVEEGREVFVEFGPQAEAQKATVSGRLLDRGQPLAGRMLMFMRSDAGSGLVSLMSSFKMVTTGEGGAFKVDDVEPGTYRVFVGAQGGGEPAVGLNLKINEGGEIEQDIELPEGRLEGEVVRARNGKPIPGAKVMLVDPRYVSRPLATIGDMMNMIIAQGVSTEKGAFEIPNAPGGSWIAQVMAEGYAPLMIDGVRVKEKGGRPVRYRLEEGHRISVTVTGSDGVPVSGASVITLDDRGRRYMDPNELSQNTGTNGKTEVRLAPGNHRLIIQSKNHAQADVKVRVTGDAEEKVVLTSGGSLHVTATDATGPVEGAMVRIFRSDGREIAFHVTQAAMMGGMPSRETGADGKIVLPHLPAGAHRVVVTDPDGHMDEADVRIVEGGDTAVVLRMQ